MTDLPVKAIVYTRNHFDHVPAVKAFATEEDVASGKVEIFAHETLLQGVINWASTVGPIAGVRMNLKYVPSETDDEIVAWFLDLELLNSAEVMQGENFPNLYTIRGTKYRDPVKWFKGIDVLRGFPSR